MPRPTVVTVRVLGKLEGEIEALQNSKDEDKKEFMEFALSFINDTGKHFLEEYVSKENRLRCKQLVFPTGIKIDQKNKVYTPEVSIFYRLAAKKKDAEASNNSHLVPGSGHIPNGILISYCRYL